jgi:hypothetical protein
MCTTTRDIGFPGSASASAVSGSPARLSFVHRPPPLAKRVHPPILSLPCRALPLRVRPAAAVSAKLLPGGSFPLRDINQERPLDPRFPGPESVPSSAFRTPSTVSAAPGLAGLFHPAAASRVRSSGVFPPVKPYHLVGGRCPPAVTAGPLPVVAHRAPQTVGPPTGPCSSPGSVAAPSLFRRRHHPIPS